MKKILVSSFLIVATAHLHAQAFFTQPAKPSFGFKPKTSYYKPYGSSFVRGDTVFISGDTSSIAPGGYPNIDNMPVKDLSGQLLLTYAGPATNGLEVFTATPDKMPVIKPGRGFASYMPVVNPAEKKGSGW